MPGAAVLRRALRIWLVLALLVMTAGVQLAALTGARAATVSPADPDASPATANLLDWLSQLPSSVPGTGHVASGYFAGYSASAAEGGDANGFGGNSEREVATMESATGQDPKIIACDYGVNGGTGIDYSCNKYLEAWANQGGIVSVSVHFPDPGTGDAPSCEDGACDVQESCTTVPMYDQCFEELGEPSTPTGAAWAAELSQVAAGLAQLATYQLNDGQVGIPVLFRPLMEMNGNWFWWGDQSSADFTATWQYMFTTINADLSADIKAADPGLGTDSRNLLWVYAANCGSDPQADYPGGGYVDIVGADCYEPESATSPYGFTSDSLSTLQSSYNALTALGKPFAFTELGAGTANEPYNFGTWLRAFAQYFPSTCYFLSWNSEWGYDVAQDDPSDDNVNSFSELMNGADIVDLNTVLSGFSSGSTDGWAAWSSQAGGITGGPWSISSSDDTDWAPAGFSYALKANVSVDEGQQAILDYTGPMDFAEYTQLTAWVNVAAWQSAGAGMTAELYVEAGPGNTWYDDGPVPVPVPSSSTGPGVELTLNLSSIPDLTDITQVGVLFVPTSGATGTSAIYVGDVAAS
jgi:mannan endo-1,4-beta-mannosidase